MMDDECIISKCFCTCPLSKQEGHVPLLWSFVRVSPVQQTCSVSALVLQRHLSASVSRRDSTSVQV